jgi:hypothetical protein
VLSPGRAAAGGRDERGTYSAATDCCSRTTSPAT